MSIEPDTTAADEGWCPRCCTEIGYGTCDACRLIAAERDGDLCEGCGEIEAFCECDLAD